MTFEERLQEGLEGKYSGLSNGLERINNHIFGIQRSCYTLIGGLSGSAKTTLVDYMLLNAIQDAEAKNIPINIFYYSYEIDEISKKANWLSMLIYMKYDIVITPQKIKCMGDLRPNADELQLIRSEKPEMEKLFAKITWRWETGNPTGLYKEWWDFMAKRGTFEKEPYIDENGVPKERIVKYIPNNSEEYNIAVIDHIALMKMERGFSLKENLDKLSEYAVSCRNMFKMTFIFLQQFNQSLNSVDRQKFKGVDVSPQQNDFKDSTNPYTDADVVLGILNAHKMDMETCLGYNINVDRAEYNLKDRFRMLKVIKNRMGRDNIAIGLLFIPEGGSFEELPAPHMLTQDYKDRINKLINNR